MHKDRFQSYLDKKKEIRILKEHFENNFSFTIAPQKEEKKDDKK